MAKSNIGYTKLEEAINYTGVSYSPNNIRRIIISPEGVGVYFYVDKAPIYKPFSLLDYSKSLSQPDFKPMLKNLYSGKQLTSIEEIIVVPMGSNGQNMLHPDEYSVQTIIGNRGASSFDGCKNSYKRLRYISIINGITFSNLFDFLKKAGNVEFISELDQLRQYIDATEVWGNDYYKQNGISIKSREMYPVMDGAGGKLVRYFETVKVNKEKEFKSIEISKQKMEATKGLREDFSKVYKDYDFAFRCNTRLYNIIRKQGFNALTSSETDIVPLRAELKSFSGLNSNATNITVVPCNNDKEALEYNIKVLREHIQKIYINIVRDLFKRILACPYYTSRVIMYNCDCVVAPKGNELIELNEQIKAKIGKSFKGESILDSIANACAYTCKFFISSYDNSSLSKYYEKQTWVGGK